MPHFDFKCPACGLVIEDVWISVTPTPTQLDRPCTRCKTPMEKLPPAANFKINGYNAKNGYSK